MVGIGAVASGSLLLNRQANSEAGVSGAAAAEWPGPVRYGASAHSALEFNEEFMQIFYHFTYFSRYFHDIVGYSSDMISYMISP